MRLARDLRCGGSIPTKSMQISSLTARDFGQQNSCGTSRTRCCRSRKISKMRRNAQSTLILGDVRRCQRWDNLPARPRSLVGGAGSSGANCVVVYRRSGSLQPLARYSVAGLGPKAAGKRQRAAPFLELFIFPRNLKPFGWSRMSSLQISHANRPKGLGAADDYV